MFGFCGPNNILLFSLTGCGSRLTTSPTCHFRMFAHRVLYVPSSHKKIWRFLLNHVPVRSIRRNAHTPCHGVATVSDEDMRTAGRLTSNDCFPEGVVTSASLQHSFKMKRATHRCKARHGHCTGRRGRLIPVCRVGNVSRCLVRPLSYSGRTRTSDSRQRRARYGRCCTCLASVKSTRRANAGKSL